MEENQPQTTLRETLESNLDAIEQPGTSPEVQEVQDTRARDQAGRFEAERRCRSNHAGRAGSRCRSRATSAGPAAAAAPDDVEEGLSAHLGQARHRRSPDSRRGEEARGVFQPARERVQDRRFHVQSRSPGCQGSAGGDYSLPAGAAAERDRPGRVGEATGACALRARQGHAGTEAAGLPRAGEAVQRAARRGGRAAQSGAADRERTPRPDRGLEEADDWRHEHGASSRKRPRLRARSIDSPSDTAKYPHFQLVREQMAQLLELGLAHDLDTAYEKSVWMVPEAREAQQLASAQQTNRTAVVAKARAAAVSPRSATPSGQVATTGAKDRRALLEEALDSQAGGRV
jgi:hypothetical protein